MELYSKPSSYQFNHEELNLIREYMNTKRKDYRVKYGFYEKTLKNLPIIFIIDSAVHSPRKSGVENKWKIICDRPIFDIEFEEVIENFGTNKRRFQVWYYRDIETLIEDDKKYELQTPEKFIQECRLKQYCKN